jgi:hypothetical protein
MAAAAAADAEPPTPHPNLGSGFSTLSVALATTPTVVSTFFAHLFARPRRKSAARKSIAEGGPGGGPDDQLSYEEGLRVVRRFIEFASHHGVEEVQAFTAMQVPTPREWNEASCCLTARLGFADASPKTGYGARSSPYRKRPSHTPSPSSQSTYLAMGRTATRAVA